LPGARVDILYLLIPLSAVLVLFIVAVFGWAVHRGQFEDIDHEAERILTDDPGPLDTDQAHARGVLEESRVRHSGAPVVRGED
jgi:cbb3-type cytochrome oxidase maturation protein